MFREPDEETTDEFSHVEQHGTNERSGEHSHTIGDAIDIAFQQRHAESTSKSSKLELMTTSKDK